MSEPLPRPEVFTPVADVETTEVQSRRWRPSRQALTRLAIVATVPELPYVLLTGGGFVWESPIDDARGAAGWGRVAVHAGQAAVHLGSKLWGLVT